ncbi:hypothetical protein ACRRTK_003329 [Alexandromys fortis]
MNAQLISTSQRTDQHTACVISAGKWLLEHPFLSLCLPLPRLESSSSTAAVLLTGLQILVTPRLFPLEGGVCHLLFFFSFSNSLVFCQLTFFHECLDVPSLLIVFVLHSCSSSPLLDLFFVPLLLCFRAKEKPEALQIIFTHILVCTLV